MATVFPIKIAYDYAVNNELTDEIAKIRQLPPKRGFRYMTGARRGYMIELFERRGILDDFLRSYWPEGLEPSGKSMITAHLRRKADYDELEDLEDDDDRIDEDEDSAAFAYEADLRNFLSKNLGILEPGLELCEIDGRPGVEFQIDEGRIDILAKDVEGRYVVVELKLSRGRNRALGQLLYYMGWVDATLSDDRPCRGFVIAKEIGRDLVLACERTPGVELFTYSLQVTVNRVAASGLR